MSKRPKPVPAVYPNAPLSETTSELHFPGEPAIECHRDEIYAAVRRELPEVHVPTSLPQQAPALQHYKFTNAEGTRYISIAINSLAYTTKRYPGFAGFKEEALACLTGIGKRFQLDGLTRVGLRYINIIPFARRDHTVPLSDFLKVRVELPGEDAAPPAEIAIALAKPCGDGTLTTRLESLRSSDKAREAILLDFDFALASEKSPLKFAKIADYLDAGHAYTKAHFESLITERYRKSMTEEVVR
ncbi:MAG: TIGR04255 family protein [Planctomycetes bacterium]|nr:TIGR04255 family protein [Planctomycetota bacterium]